MSITSYEKRKYKENVKSFYKRLEKYYLKDKTSGTKEYFKVKRDIETLEAKIEKGYATSKDIEKGIDKLKRYRGKELNRLVQVFSEERDKFVSIGTDSIWLNELQELTSTRLQGEFENPEEIVKQYKAKDNSNLPEVDTSNITLEYNDAYLTELINWLNTKPVGALKEIGTSIERLISMYGRDIIAYYFYQHEETLPDLNQKMYYDPDLKAYYSFLDLVENILNNFSQDDIEDIRKALNNTRQELEKEENFNG